MGARDLLRDHFLANIGRVLDSKDLRKIAGISEWARRVRELREDEGFDIQTHNDRADLKPGEYVLTTGTPRPSFSRSMSKELRAFVLDRNGPTCQKCGAVAGEPHPDDAGRRVRLHIGHILEKSKGGTDEPSNLRAECSVCNEGMRNLSLERPTAVTLLTQVRRAKRDDQLAVLRWLQSKFPDVAARQTATEPQDGANNEEPPP
jgi:5-methylcytosine-specific restriction endonuclease McrA